MKKTNSLLLFLLLIATSFSTFAQDIKGQRVIIGSQLVFKNATIDSIQKDTAFIGNNVMPTSKAIKDYITPMRALIAGKQSQLSGVGLLTFNGITPSYVPTLDSTIVPSLHSQTYYDLRFGSLTTVASNTTNIATNTTNITTNTASILVAKSKAQADSTTLSNYTTSSLPTASGYLTFTGHNVEVNTLATVAGFSTFNIVNATRLIVSDTTRGGIFFLYAGSDAADNGMIFTDALSRKWHRVQADSKINIQWYGAAGTTTGTDNDALAQIQAARNYCYAHPGDILYIPRATTGVNQYYVSNTLNFADHDISISGDNIGASGGNGLSVLSFPSNVLGLDFNETINAPHYVTLKNIYITSPGASPFNNTKHGIQSNINANFENVYVNQFSGNGFHITGDGATLGNSDRSQFVNCEANYCNNGWYITGSDANIIVFNNCSGIQNRRWGFYDNGFLGNNYTNCHTAVNALQLVAPNFVKASYNGVNYVAINNDDINNTNFRPDLNPDKWAIYEVQGAQPAWDNTRTYLSGGAFASTNISAFNVYNGNYSEGYQPPSRYSSRSLVYGGTQEAGFSGGGNISANFGSIINHSPANFERPLSFGNIYSATSGIIPHNDSTAPDKRYTDIEGSNGIANIRLFGNNKTVFGGNSFTIAPEGTQSATLPNGGTEYGYHYSNMNGFAGPTLIFGGAGYNYWFNLAKRTSGVTTPLFSVNESDGRIVAVNLAGTGNRMVTTSATGQLSSSALPLTTFSKTDNFGIVSSITNSTTTPNHTIGVDTTVIVSKTNLSGNLANYVPISGGAVTGALSGITTSLVDSTNQFSTTKYVKQLFASIPKADSAYAGYGFKIDSILVNSKYTLQLRVDSAKIASDVHAGLTVTGPGGTYNPITGALNLTGGSTLDKVDTLNTQNVRGIKTFIGSISSDGAPQTEQLGTLNWTSTGWTGSFTAGWTNTAANTTPLTNILAATNGQLYQLYWTVTGWTAGSFTVSFGGITQSGITATGNSGGVPATSTANYSITPTSDFNGTIVPSVKSIGFSAANQVWTSSDGTNTLQLRVPTNAYSLGLGTSSLRRITTGINNLAFGNLSQQTNTSGNGNTSVGNNSLSLNTVGGNNTALGLNAGGNNSTGGSNSFLGYFAGGGNTTGSANVASGPLSLLNATTGSNNTAVGSSSGRYVTPSTALVNCNNCTFLGSDTKAGVDGLSYAAAIGSGAITLAQSNSIQIGATSNGTVSLTGHVITGSLTDNGTDQLQVTGSAKITGQLNIPTGSLSTSAVNLAQLNAAITAGATNTARLVDTATNQGISGSKTFRVEVTVPTAIATTSAVNLGQMNAAIAALPAVNTAAFVDTLSGQNVRGLKTFIGSTSSDGPAQTEQLSTGWTSAGWTGSFATGFTNNASNVTPLTNSYVVVSGQLYQVTYTITGRTTGSITIAFGGISLPGITATGNTSATTSSTAGYSVTPTSDFNGTIVPSLKTVGYSAANAVWTSSDKTSNIFEMRVPVNAYSLGFGVSDLRRVTTGINNLAFGNLSQPNTTVGSGNMSFGTNTLSGNNTGGNNIAFGLNAGSGNTSGGSNSFLGYFAGAGNTIGTNNVALGSLSLLNATTGSNNAAIGGNAGRYLSGGSTSLVNCNNCTFVGADTKAGIDNLTNATAVGYGAVTLSQSNSVQVGSASNTVVSLTGRVITGSLTDNTTDQLQVTGSAKITGQLNIPNGTLSTSAVNLSQLNAAIPNTASFMDTLNNQTISGIKTYRSEVAVPTATLGVSAVNLTQMNSAITTSTATIVSGSYIQSQTPITNISSSASGNAVYMRIGNVVHVRLIGNFTPTAAGTVVLNITLPIATSNGTQTTIGTASMKENAGTSYANGEINIINTTTVQTRYLATTTANVYYTLEFDYQL